MKHRIFIAINLPLEVRTKLLEWKAYLPSLPARWTKPENIHLTLVFIGYVLNPQLKEIAHVSNTVASGHKNFELKITRVHFGPSHGSPRMIWAEIENHNELITLQKNLEDNLYENPRTGFREKENRPYRPHLTLARFDPAAFQRLTPKPTLDEKLEEIFPVTSVDLMESTLTRFGADYSLLKSIPLNRV